MNASGLRRWSRSGLPWPSSGRYGRVRDLRGLSCSPFRWGFDYARTAPERGDRCHRPAVYRMPHRATSRQGWCRCTRVAGAMRLGDKAGTLAAQCRSRRCSRASESWVCQCVMFGSLTCHRGLSSPVVIEHPKSGPGRPGGSSSGTSSCARGARGSCTQRVTGGHNVGEGRGPSPCREQPQMSECHRGPIDPLIGRTREGHIANIEAALAGGRLGMTIAGLTSTRDPRADMLRRALARGRRRTDLAHVHHCRRSARTGGSATQPTSAPTAIALEMGRSDSLLVLDNLEQVVGARELTAKLQVGLPASRVLGTSRMRLDVRGEVVVTLDPTAPARRRRRTSTFRREPPVPPGRASEGASGP